MTITLRFVPETGDIKDAGNMVIAYVNRAVREKNPALGRCLAAAPEMLAACKAQHDAIDHLLALLITADPKFRPTKSGPIWDAVEMGHAAIAKATTP